MLQIYTDIIDSNYLGEQNVYLLDVIPIKHIFGKNDTLTTSKRINRRIVDSISIKITDEKGIAVSFTDRVLIGV